MTIELSFDGSTECRGRNRWFQLREVELSHHQWDQSMAMYCYSSKRGNIAPIVLHFHHAEELRTLICGLAKALAQMTTTHEETTDGLQEASRNA